MNDVNYSQPLIDSNYEKMCVELMKPAFMKKYPKGYDEYEEVYVDLVRCEDGDYASVEKTDIIRVSVEDIIKEYLCFCIYQLIMPDHYW